MNQLHKLLRTCSTRLGWGHLLFLSFAVAPAAAQVISFEYTQSDKSTGGGSLSGVVDGIFYTGEMPAAVVQQVDESELPIPDGMVGYMDGWQEAQPGNPYGVHIGWEGGTVTLTGEKVISPTTLEIFELEVPLVISDDGTPEADWSYETVLTDDGGAGNDAFGTGLRIAGWVGDPGDGHRHSAGAFGDWAQGAVDTATVRGSHGDVGGNGRGDELGIGISLRNANGSGETKSFIEYADDEGIDPSGPIYVDSVQFAGGLTVTDASPKKIGTPLAADINVFLSGRGNEI